MATPEISVLISVAALLGSAACATGMQEDSLPALSVVDVVNRVDSLRGQTVRVCGREFRKLYMNSDTRVWRLVGSSIGYHPSKISVLPCGDIDPRPDARNCITGRIAREDGSIRPYLGHEPGQPLNITDPGTTNIWYLHAQCPSRTR